MESQWPFLDHRFPLAFAHRGAHSPEGPTENTIEAFSRAVEMGFSYVETDVHLTLDGRVVAFHDESLDRLTDRKGLIRELRWSEVVKAKVGPEGSTIPLLEDVLDSWPGLRVNIDPKADDVVPALATVLNQSNAVERVCCGSFSDSRLAELRRLIGPQLCTSLGPRAVARLTAATYGAPIRKFPAPCAQVPTHIKGKRLVTERFVSSAHELGLSVHIWTIDERAEMSELLDLGVDGIMTDKAEVLKGLLTGLGRWPAGSSTTAPNPQFD